MGVRNWSHIEAGSALATFLQPLLEFLGCLHLVFLPVKPAKLNLDSFDFGWKLSRGPWLTERTSVPGDSLDFVWYHEVKNQVRIYGQEAVECDRPDGDRTGVRFPEPLGLPAG
jgi:hypothetical protein